MALYQRGRKQPASKQPNLPLWTETKKQTEGESFMQSFSIHNSLYDRKKGGTPET